MMRVWAVSYTHLDVYKRQEVHQLGNGLVLDGSSNNFDNGLEFKHVISVSKVLISSKVSELLPAVQ